MGLNWWVRYRVKGAVGGRRASRPTIICTTVYCIVFSRCSAYLYITQRRFRYESTSAVLFPQLSKAFVYPARPSPSSSRRRNNLQRHRRRQCLAASSATPLFYRVRNSHRLHPCTIADVVGITVPPLPSAIGSVGPVALALEDQEHPVHDALH